MRVLNPVGGVRGQGEEASPKLGVLRKIVGLVDDGFGKAFSRVFFRHLGELLRTRGGVADACYCNKPPPGLPPTISNALDNARISLGGQDTLAHL